MRIIRYLKNKKRNLGILKGNKIFNINGNIFSSYSIGRKIDDYILGYTCANDISARDCQLDLDEQWARGKSFDTFCPLGPWIETNLNPMKCSIKSILNNKIMQNSNTSDMIFNVKELVSYLSYNMSLLPGTVFNWNT